MEEQPWAENVLKISEEYEEVYPSGRKPYEMIHFGPLYESRFLYIPKDVKDVDEYILEARRKMHSRLERAVIEMVNKAIDSKTVLGVNKR